MAERYSKWSDKKSGVNPFVPDEGNRSSLILQLVSFVLIGIPRLTLCVFLFIINMLIDIFCNGAVMICLIGIYLWKNDTTDLSMTDRIIVATTLLFTLIEVTPLYYLSPNHMAKTISKFIVGRIALPLLGVEYSQQSANTARVVGSKNENIKNSTPFSTCNSGDIIISNVTNVLDKTPLFVFPLQNKDTANNHNSITTYTYKKAKFFNAIKIISSMKGISSCTSDNAKSLNDIITYAKKSNYVVVLFIEGVRHNGTAVMKFPIETFSTLSQETNIHLSGFVYSSTNQERKISPVLPIGSTMQKIFQLVSSIQFPYNVTVNFLASEHVPKLSSGNTGSPKLDIWVQQLRDIFARLVSKKTVDLSIDDFESFAKYYSLHAAGLFDQAKSVAETRAKTS